MGGASIVAGVLVLIRPGPHRDHRDFSYVGEDLGNGFIGWPLILFGASILIVLGAYLVTHPAGDAARSRRSEEPASSPATSADALPSATARSRRQS